MLKKGMCIVICICTAVLLLFCGCEKEAATETEKQVVLRPQKKASKSIFDDEKDYEGYEEYDAMAHFQPDQREKSYDALKLELEEHLSAKHFPETANEMMRQILEKLFDNYENWDGIYSFLPDRYTFIRTHFLDIIPMIQKITFYEEGTPEYEEFMENHSVSTGASDGDQIFFVCLPEKEDGKYDDFFLEILLHEMQHILQMQLRTEPFEPSCRDVMLDGGASYYSGFIYKYSFYASTGEQYNGAEMHYFEPMFGAGGNYAFYQNLYEKLVYFAGYQTMEYAIHGGGFSAVKKSLAHEYGLEDARAWMEAWIRLLIYHGEKSLSGTDTLFNQAVELEKISVRLMEKKIAVLDSAERVLQFADEYRRYKAIQIMRFGPVDDYTTEVLQLDALDELLAQKIEKYLVFSFCDDPQMNHWALRALLTRPLNEEDMPVRLFGKTQYFYEEEDGIGALYVKESDSSGGYVYSFTKDGFRYCDEIKDWGVEREYRPFEYFFEIK